MTSRSRLACCTGLVLSLCLSPAAAAQNAAGRVVHRAGPATATAAAAATAVTAVTAVTVPLTAADRDAIVEKLAVGIEEGYVLEAKGYDLARRLRQLGAAGSFANDDPNELAKALTRSLREISADRHLRVSFGSMASAMGGPRRRMVRVAGGPGAKAPGATPATPSGGPVRIRRVGKSDKMSELFDEMAAGFPDNYRARILPGNVGLLEIDILFPPNDRLDAAMRELAETDALILDLRSCPGGTNLTSLPLESAFFAESTHLRTMAVRGQEPMRVESVEETSGGVRYLGKHLYVLTSPGTGSACEALAWTLKYHDRAVLVGETTAGAGHGITGTLDLGHDLTATIPSMRPIHPRFEGGWEGIGVPPEVTIASRRAAGEAHLMALMAIMENTEGTALRELESLYDATAREIGRQERDHVDHGRSLRSYCASFEKGRRLHVKDGELYYTADGRLRGPLVSSGEPDHFEVGKGMMKMNLALERGNDGNIEGLRTSPAGSDEWERFKRELSL